MVAYIELPAEIQQPTLSLEAALTQRRSVRSFRRDATLSLQDLGQLLWAAQGITGPEGTRTTPSAGGLYPIRLYIAAGSVEGLTPAVYRYEAQWHSLTQVVKGDMRQRISDTAMQQDWMLDSQAIITIAADYHVTTAKYYKRGIRYLFVEAGATGQNIALQATGLGLGAGVVGAFDDSVLSHILTLSEREYPLSLVPVGIPA